MPSLRLFTVALSLSAQSAYSFAPQTLNVRTQPRAAVALQRPHARVARPLRTGAVFATASKPASASAAPSMISLARSVVLRVATALMCTLATLLLTATRALAKSAVASAPGGVATGDMIKWGGMALLFGGACIAGGKSNTASSGFEYVEEEDTGFAAGAGSLEARPKGDDDDDAETPSSSPFDGVSDSAFSSALSARMAALASGAPDEDEKPAEPPKKDDTGVTGSTGLMERPKPSDVPSVDKGAVDDFPVGFPLRDFEPEDVAPAASAADIEMLARMFGTGEPSKDD